MSDFGVKPQCSPPSSLLVVRKPLDDGSKTINQLLEQRDKQHQASCWKRLINFDEFEKRAGDKGSPAPDWRIVYPGVNMEGWCSTETCPAFQMRVLAPKSFGNFNISKHVLRCHCPMCNNYVRKVSKLYIYGSVVKFQGQITLNNVEIDLEEVHEEPDCFLMIDLVQGESVTWAYLEVDAKEIKMEILS